MPSGGLCRNALPSDNPMTTFVNNTPNSSTFTPDSKNSATWSQSMRHGKDLGLDALADKTFNDTIYDGDSTQLKDFTFNQIGQDQSWTNQPTS